MNERSARRLGRLTEALARGGTLRLSEAARLCGVSEMTIRRDLSAGDGGLTLIGGHLVRADDPRYAPLYDLATQQDRQAEAKQRLCEVAARHIEDGDTLFVDCGTTLMPLVSGLDQERSLTVVTYALNVANALSRLPGVRLVLLGGVYHPSSQTFASDDIVARLSRLGINKAFITAAGVHAKKGVSCFHFHEVAPKQAAIACATQRLLVADDSKAGIIRPAYFATLDDFDVVITGPESGLETTAGRPQIIVA
ncbi:transcriptional regulator, DeoR family [Modicisalibacter ilicicola DSM 19980]|uniref:Transcriptional regulator, DeoR family n=1 Tax=Modicisalibacter ilicicola DSM 19980 TaxID=1121942 RepID=A0A1M4SM01_9GAMM|nr:DeoR family transcriptional regulator [Halomonas ilicicola]SHE33294.1 transcriptional regulator, DeoR family [Halomonas ilicicola DSM 19980]